MEYKSNNFTIISISSTADYHLIQLKLASGIRKVLKNSCLYSVIKKEGKIYTLKTSDMSEVNFFLSHIDVYLNGRNFTAKDYDGLIDIVIYPFLETTRLFIEKALKEPSPLIDIYRKIDVYLFGVSPFYAPYSEYHNYEILTKGIDGIIDRISELDSHYYIDKTINQYSVEDVKEKTYFISLCQHSLIPPLAIKTTGFNQDFRGKNGDHLSCVTLKLTDEGYRVKVVGIDDSSYSKYFKTKMEALQIVKKLKGISTILTKYHLYYLMFKFTN